MNFREAKRVRKQKTLRTLRGEILRDTKNNTYKRTKTEETQETTSRGTIICFSPIIIAPNYISAQEMLKSHQVIWTLFMWAMFHTFLLTKLSDAVTAVLWTCVVHRGTNKQIQWMIIIPKTSCLLPKSFILEIRSGMWTQRQSTRKML